MSDDIVITLTAAQVAYECAVLDEYHARRASDEANRVADDRRREAVEAEQRTREAIRVLDLAVLKSRGLLS